jgi:prephenate dehydrogenase
VRLSEIDFSVSEKMTVGICGLGLIGGSLARAYSESGQRVYGYDRDGSVLPLAKLSGAACGELNENTVGECDLIIIALYPEATVEYFKSIAPFVRKDAIVMDCCGVKEVVCSACFDIAKEYGITFVGGHPMAGKQYSGFGYSKGNLFSGAPMLIVPPCRDDIGLYEKIKELLSPLGLGRIRITSAEEHDRMIAFTSQLAHIVSNAYVKSPTAQSHKGFSAGSYKDLTRVAWLNETMWSELFLDNADNVIFELDSIISSLEEYRDAIKNNDRETLTSLLKDGRICKERVDG